MSRAAVLAILLVGAGCQRRPAPSPSAAGERAYRANNLGVALLEQLRYPDAASAFRDALALDPALGIARANLGIALLYAQELGAAQEAATEAARLLPMAPQPLYVLGLIARAENRPDAAAALFDRVRALDPTDVGAAINAAQLKLEASQYAEAVAILETVVESEPFNITAAYVLGLALTRAGEVDRGRQMLERAQALRGSGYGVTLGTGYLEQGRYAEAIASTGAEPELVDEATPDVRFVPERIAAGGAPVGALDSPFGRRFRQADLTEAGARSLAAAMGGALAPIDIDADGDLDIVHVAPSGQTVLRNDGDVWTDVTGAAGLGHAPEGSVPIGAVAGDYDNDGATDLFVLRFGRSSLYRNNGQGRFVDVTEASRIPAFPYLPGTAAFVDVDHDGDLDVIVGGLADLAATAQRSGPEGWVFPTDFAPAPLQLLRNNRNGTFTDVTRDASLDQTGHTIAIVPTDFDNRRDVDLLLVDRVAPPRLLANQRDGTFRDVTSAVGLSGVSRPGQPIAAVAAADVNKDDWPDLFFAREDGGVFALSNGRGQFTVSAPHAESRGAIAARHLDYDGDGLLDLLTWTDQGPRVFRNIGRRWLETTTAAMAPASGEQAATRLASARGLALADFDGDGRTDAVASGAGGLHSWRNQGASPNSALRIGLRGRVSNPLGIGAKVQIRAGSLSARLEVSSASPAIAPADLVFGLGQRAGADVARVLWPSGIVQAETAASTSTATSSNGASGAGNARDTGDSSASTGANASEGAALSRRITIEELDRKPSSCPLLFTWNGERFEFVTDFLGGGELGYWEGPGRRNQPDPIEYVRIRGDQLRPRDGRLELRLTNELEEAVFFDRVRLLVVEHPRAIEVHPNEGMTEPAKPFALHAVENAYVPRRVTDDAGRNVTALVANADWRAPDGFLLAPIRGYAAPHSLTIEIDPQTTSNALLLTGWTDYAFSSDNVAAYQAGIEAMPPRLDIEDVGGAWRDSGVAVGIPVGRPQTIALDLGRALRPGDRRLRLTTNMRVYWDRVLVGALNRSIGVQPRELDARTATLSARGFSATVPAGAGAPARYDYARVEKASPWKTLPGHYTREGDVLELLQGSDDLFVITKPGDEMTLAFDAAPLGPLPDGWTRTFLLRAEGFSKEMDINSASPDALEPLPFRNMTRYPYGPDERYPDTAVHRRYRETYNTRTVTRALSSLAGAP